MRYLIPGLFESKSNESEVVIRLTNILGVKITASTVTKEIEEHPDHPSLFCISDVLTKFGIDNVGVKPDQSKFDDIPTPFITRIRSEKSHESFFTVVKENTSSDIVFFDQEKFSWRRVPRDAFLKGWHGFALLVETAAGAFERNYLQKRKKEKKQRIISLITAIAIPILLIVLGLLDLFRNGPNGIVAFIYLLISLLGTVISLLLVWSELDDQNAMLNKICSASKKVNCRAVLQSGMSKIAGISWSAIGLGYFSSQVLILLFKGFESPPVHFVLALGSLFALPYIPLSIFYQWRVIKEWCILCITVQGLLILQFLVIAFGRWFVNPIGNTIAFTFLLQTFSIYAITYFFILCLISALQKIKEGVDAKKQLQQLKHNQELFWSLLQQQKAVTDSPAGLGITVGNPRSRYKILKICNPNCGPCSKAHQELHRLLEINPDLQLQIIFMAPANEIGDSTTKVASHLLSISERFDEATKRQALDDWYLPDQKNYESFAAKYPLSDELKQQSSKIAAMRAWCQKTKIDSTPTIFVGIPDSKNEHSPRYYQLPRIYAIAELQYLFKSVEFSKQTFSII